MKNGMHEEEGVFKWYKNGKLHREDGPAIETLKRTKHWYINGERHRVDNPAVEWASGDREWYCNDKLHHEEGPAIEWADGKKEWYLNGKKIEEEEFNHWLMKKNLNQKLHSNFAQKQKEKRGKI